jgi:hypothetical protein
VREDLHVEAAAMTKRPRTRPSPELLDRLRRGKAELRTRRTEMSLKEKVSMVLKLQRVYLPLLKRHRPLAPWERPWDVEP